MSFQPLRRNPVRYRFALPNQIWTWKLKPPAFAVLAYLCWLHGHSDDNSAHAPGSLAMRLHMSSAMAAACLGALLRRGLVPGQGGGDRRGHPGGVPLLVRPQLCRLHRGPRAGPF